MRVNNSFESLRTGTSKNKPSAISNWVVFSWVFALVYISTICIIVSLDSEVSGLRTLQRQWNKEAKVNLIQRYIEVASSCFGTQERVSLEILDSLLGFATLEDTDSKFDVCPVVLSTVNRVAPHWLWTVASLYNGFADEQLGVAPYSTRFSPPTIIWRRGAAFDQMKDEKIKTRVNELLKRGFIRPLLGQSEKYMPYLNKFKHMIFASKWQEAQHFAKQAFDHVMAMEDCFSRGCKYCLILEDDIIVSSNWRKRVSEAIANQGTTWGILKLFELDDRIRLASPVEGWEIEDVPYLLAGGAFVGSVFTLGLYHTVLKHLRGGSGRIKITMFWVAFILWATALIALMGHDAVINDSFDSIREHKTDPTSFRRARHPTRGAVANMYKDIDIPSMTSAIKDMVWYAADSLHLRPSNERVRNAERFFSHFPFSTDPLRIDVVVAKYFMDKQRPILILEPNVVQHIGFISTEPLNKAPFTAMSSTFEDGKVA